MKSLLSIASAPLLVALPLFGAQAQAQGVPSSQAWGCTAPAFKSCSFTYDPGWDEYNNTWNNPSMPPNAYTLYANSHSDWEEVANQAKCPTTSCAVEAYASAQYNFQNEAGAQEIADITKMSSYFNQTMPTGNLYTNGFDSEAAYDIWLDNYNLEVMVWVDDQGQTPGGQIIGTANLFGQDFIVYHSGALDNPNSGTYSFVLAENESSGYVDILDVLQWLTANTYIPTSDYMTQFNFGWEIASTGGQTDTFRLNGLTLDSNLVPRSGLQAGPSPGGP